jgi:protein TonB
VRVFDTLIASKPKRQKSLGETIFSVVIHVVLIIAAVKATSAAEVKIREIIADTSMVLLKPPEPEPEPEPETPPPDAIVSANPPPQGFQTLMPPDAIPKEIPPINLNERFNPKDFTGKGVEGGIAAGVVGGTGPVDVSGQTFLEAQVDDPPRLLQPGPMRFPPVLESAGITGRVRLEFIVDTTGHAERPSIKVLETSHPAFAEPAKELVAKSLFKPGRVRGQAVRVLVQQTVNYTPPNQ